MLFLAELIVKVSSWILRHTGSGGETWPGELVLRLMPSIKQELPKLFDRVIVIAGTNGKTSTTKCVSELLVKHGKKVITNPSGANLVNGMVSSILARKSWGMHSGYWGVFEVDEFSLSAMTAILTPTHILLLNIVRDQLDRYGEVRTILDTWGKTLQQFPDASIIALAADPGIYTMLDLLDLKHVSYYAIPTEFLQQQAFVAGDSLYCYACNHKLSYSGRYVSHMGAWKCSQCKREPHDVYTFPKKVWGMHTAIPSFMLINLQGVYLLMQQLGIPIDPSEVLSAWKPAYGRGETKTVQGTHYTFVLGKNPASWSIVLRDYSRKFAQDPVAVVVLGLNNRIPDGKDVSWIWDIDIDNSLMKSAKSVWIYGDRAYDMQLRLKEAGIAASRVIPSAHELFYALKQEHPSSALVVANYSALLESRKEVLGKSIL
ncbi:MAG: MurT ligase domain-containing protein [Candidatus Roizmanbacteria bacterium]|nr:MurT ligase domain-containing protein [Candidatus Roizmanbacteria bacterium]